MYAKDAREWRNDAEGAFLAATLLFACTDPRVWFSASLVSHHAIEMLLKSALIRVGFVIRKGKGEPNAVWGHSLRTLANKLAETVPQFRAVLAQKPSGGTETNRDYLATFDAYFSEFRYPKAPTDLEGLKAGDMFGGQETNDAFIRLFKEISRFAFDISEIAPYATK
jgi:HEPN domain-containing protein